MSGRLIFNLVGLVDDYNALISQVSVIGRFSNVDYEDGSTIINYGDVVDLVYNYLHSLGYDSTNIHHLGMSSIYIDVDDLDGLHYATLSTFSSSYYNA